MIPDTKKRVKFGKNASVREDDSHKSRMEGISPYALERIGMRYTDGGIKYGDFRNWERGQPWSRCIGAILRHTTAYMRRDTSEDHLAAIAWNAIALMHFESLKEHAQFDDRPMWGEEE